MPIKDAAWHDRAKLSKALRGYEELDGLGQLELGLFAAGDVGKLDEAARQLDIATLALALVRFSCASGFLSHPRGRL